MTELNVIEDRPIPYLIPVEGGRAWATKDAESGVIRPLLSGGFDAPIQHPLGPPTISGTSITIDLMLQQPQRITSFIMDISLQKFFADLLFASGGGVTGGAMIFDIVAANEIYLDRDVERIEAGAEYPIVTSSRRAPGVAEVEKWGGRYPFTDEARDRNDQILFRNRNVQLINTIVRKNNQRAVATIEAAIASVGGATTVGGHAWSTAIPNGNAPTAPALTPHADLHEVQLLNEQRELGININAIALSPVDYNSLVLFYGEKLAAIFTNAGFSTVFTTNRIAAGNAYCFEYKGVGEMRVEQPLNTETYRDKDGRDTTWVKSGVRNLMFANNPYAVYKITGIG